MISAVELIPAALVTLALAGGVLASCRRLPPKLPKPDREFEEPPVAPQPLTPVPKLVQTLPTCHSRHGRPWTETARRNLRKGIR
jgi:hypothetical protein